MSRIMWVTAFISLCVFSAVYLTVDAISAKTNENNGNKPEIIYTVKEFEGKKYVICQVDLRCENPIAKRFLKNIYEM